MTIQIGSQTIDKANILPNENEVLDETLDTFSFSLLSDSPLPFAPSQGVKITHEDDSVSIFVISSDSVEPYTLSKELYRHTIVVTENARLLSKFVVRNSVFTQPPSRYKEAYVAHCCVPKQDSEHSYNYMEWDHIQSRIEPLNLEAAYNEKANSVKIELRLQCGISTVHYDTQNWASVSKNDFTSIAEINSYVGTELGSIHFDTPLWIHYTLNGTIHHDALNYSIFPSSTPIFNTEVECPQILSLLRQGATDLYLDTGATPFVQGYYDADGVNRHVPFVGIQLIVKAEVYSYSCYDILDLLLKRHAQSWEYEGDEFSKEAPFKIPRSGELYDLLSSTPAPNFTFTQCTLFEAVAEVFRVFDAIFTIDEEGYLGITYFNKRNAESFKRMSGINLALGEDRYVNGLVSYYQDARVEEKFPSNGTFAPSRSAELGVPGIGDHYFVTPHAIQALNEAKVLTAISVRYDSSSVVEISNYPLEIGRYIKEKSVFGVLPTDDSVPWNDQNTFKQNNTVFYQSGDNKISLAYAMTNAWGTTYYPFGNLLSCALRRQLGYFPYDVSFPVPLVRTPDTSTPKWWEVRMSVSYIATLDGRLELQTINSKFEGQMIIDQTNGAVDLSNLGRNMLGLSYKMGEPSLGAVYKPTTWANRIKKGDYITFDGATWVANACNMTLLKGGYYQERVSFVKDYNELSLRKTLLREKRFTNISRSLVLKSEENVVEFCYVSASQIQATPERTIFSKAAFENCFANSFGISTDIKSIGVACLSGGGDVSYFPMIRYGAGNMVCFEMSFDDPMSAGIQTKVNQTGWFGTVAYYSTSVNYTNPYGYIEYAYVSVSYNDEREFDDQFPKITTPGHDLFQLDKFYFYKQPNEITALNYEIAFIPIGGFFVGRRFIDDNFLVSGKWGERKLYVHYSNEKYTVTDFKAKGQRVAVASKSLVSGGISLTHGELGEHYQSWAIADEDGYFLFACNQDPYGSSKTIYFTLRRNRL